ncbi:chorismate mutase [Streptomyces sp. J2-1]|uniref:chorismate mutase n=1 Tax=Streptomyces corallincola TaxID=2851888 RepID=UPI001C393211|nr:chorismate mutase [Streptomyces corallincola]MBV2357002.1 chorismate mutase [Streptomyces corallincola]
MTTSDTGNPEADPEVRRELTRLRASIDNIDAAVVHMLAERFKATQQVGRLKARHQLPPADPAREARQIARLRGLAEDARLDPAFAEKFLNFIIAEVIRHHESIAEDTAEAGAGEAVAGEAGAEAGPQTVTGAGDRR